MIEELPCSVNIIAGDFSFSNQFVKNCFEVVTPVVSPNSLMILLLRNSSVTKTNCIMLELIIIKPRQSLRPHINDTLDLLLTLRRVGISTKDSSWIKVLIGVFERIESFFVDFLESTFVSEVSWFWDFIVEKS